MDPWLEQHWGDVHHALITYARDALNQNLPDGLRARMEERVYLESTEERLRHAVPDVRIVDFHPNRGAVESSGASGGIAVAEPLVVSIPLDPVTETFIQIIDARSGNRVVTVIEFISPTNKRKGNGRDLYLTKQEQVIVAHSSLVEIDLLRDGDRVLSCHAQIPPSYRTPYQVCVRRAWRPAEFEVYKVPLPERLPKISIPLREGDADAALDLQELLDMAYRNGGYDTLDYSTDPVPPLEGAEKAWAESVLKNRATA